MKKITITEFHIEEASGNRFELLYTPHQTQVLEAGVTYLLVFDPSKETPVCNTSG